MVYPRIEGSNKLLKKTFDSTFLCILYTCLNIVFKMTAPTELSGPIYDL